MSDQYVQISREHAKTRGYVKLALYNTQVLNRQLTRLGWVVGAVALVVLVILIVAIVAVWLHV